MQAGHIRSAVAHHQLGQAALEVVDDGLRCFPRGDVALRTTAKNTKKRSPSYLVSLNTSRAYRTLGGTQNARNAVQTRVDGVSVVALPRCLALSSD